MKYLSLLLLGTWLLSGCGKDEVQTYIVPKQKAPVEPVPAGTPASPPPRSAGFTADLPKGWTEKPGSGMRMASYAIEGTAIDFYLISLSMGDVTSNVNRWRRQVGLPAASAEAIAGEVQRFKANGREIKYIEIYNPDGGKGIIAAIVDRAPSYWYFTAKGSNEELKANAADIRAFLQSLNIQ